MEMNKTTVIGMILVAVIMAIWMSNVNQDMVNTIESETEVAVAGSDTSDSSSNKETKTSSASSITSSNSSVANSPSEETEGTVVEKEVTPKASEEKISIETDLLKVVLSTKGGDLISYATKSHLENGEPIQLIENYGNETSTLNISFGSMENDIRTEIFDYKKSGSSHIFSHDYVIEDQKVTLIKEYRFLNDEYMFELKISLINREGRSLPLLSDNFFYTLHYGPQLGPSFEKLDNYTYRKFYTYNMENENGKKDGKRKEQKVNNEVSFTSSKLSWSSLEGSYFLASFILDPATPYTIYRSNTAESLYPTTARMTFSRPTRTNSVDITDFYRIYLGPKHSSELDKYQDPDKNGFNLANTNLTLSVDKSWFIFGWVETFLKWALNMIHSIIPNYGYAIIILTLLLKLALYPTTKKSMESSKRMQEIQPKVNSLKEKYKDNPQKLNQATMELYKKENVSPAGGCLPLLLQLPILMGFFYMIRNSFELRGASFIPGWIDDLSKPETLATLNFSLPFIGSEVRLLPILYLVFGITGYFINKSIMAKKSVNSGNQQANQMGQQMAVIGLVMPIFLFFVFYSAPSGLLLYWTLTSILTTVQQYLTNRK